MKKKKRLGEMLIEANLLTEDQLKQALIEQKNTNLKLGQFLTRQSIISERQIIDLISHQLKIEKYNPEKYPVDLEMAKVITSDSAQRRQVIPLRKKGYLLTIAMPDPMDINALDHIEMTSNSEVEPVICSEQEFNALYNSLYGKYAGLGGMLDIVDDMEFFDEAGDDSLDEDLNIASLQGLAEEAPVIRLVNSIISQAVREGASDLHLTPEKNYVHLQFRVDGKLQDVPSPPKSMFLPIVSRIKILANMDIATSRIPQDGRLTIKMDNKEINIRVSTMPTIYGENLVMRLLDVSSGINSLELLGMSKVDREKIRSMLGKPYGMILSTGPTGSGKSSSLYAILKEIQRPEINIITLEDPVEYRMDKIRQVQLNHKAGMTFADGLKALLRQDPDVIMVGEIRDRETASISVQAAMTGHLVLSTVHTNDAAGAITRLLEMGLEPFLVSSVLLVTFAQRLVRKICDQCSEPYLPNEQTLKYWELNNLQKPELMRGKGCFHCKDTGFMGRIGLFETLINDELVQKMTLERKSNQEISRTAQETGRLRTLKEDAIAKVLQGITTLEEAASAVMS